MCTVILHDYSKLIVTGEKKLQVIVVVDNAENERNREFYKFSTICGAIFFDTLLSIVCTPSPSFQLIIV